MHEVSIMAEAVRMAVETAQASSATHVTGLRLRVGTLSGAVPEAMQFAWRLNPSPPLAGVRRARLNLNAGIFSANVPNAIT